MIGTKVILDFKDEGFLEVTGPEELVVALVNKLGFAWVAEPKSLPLGLVYGVLDLDY